MLAGGDGVNWPIRTRNGGTNLGFRLGYVTVDTKFSGAVVEVKAKQARRGGKHNLICPVV